jgi:phage gp46-like protein
MIDIKLIDQGTHLDIDYASNGDFDMEDGFDTAIIMSLFCEKRASESEVSEATLRRGWIGNKYYNEDGGENGSKIWVHTEQGRITNTNLNNVKNTGQLGLDWFVEQEFLNKIETGIVTVNRQPNLEVTLEYPNSKVDTRYFDVWSNTGVS